MLRPRVGAGLALFVVLILGRGGVALAYANACWNPAFDDPAHFDISDASGVMAKTVLFDDPMDGALRTLVPLPRVQDPKPVWSETAIDEPSPRANSPRAPPAP
jgi:hypothetical protein